mgnify:FL=1
MSKKIVTQGNTTNEAIEKGLKELNATREMVDIKVLEEEKRSFFSILAPRIVKVELTLKDEIEDNKEPKKVKKEIHLSKDDQQKAHDNLNNFLEEFVKKMPENTKYDIKDAEDYMHVSLENENLGFLIGYRGETLYALQNILSAIAGKGINNKVRVILDIEGYKEKREKTLEDLADKMAKTVIKYKKPVTLEPMQAYERKIIHSRLQENSRVETKSVGEEPHRRIVISLKNK